MDGLSAVLFAILFIAVFGWRLQGIGVPSVVGVFFVLALLCVYMIVRSNLVNTQFLFAFALLGLLSLGGMMAWIEGMR